MLPFRPTLPGSLLVAALTLGACKGDPTGPTARAVAWSCSTVVTPQAPQTGDAPNVQRLLINSTCQSPTLGNFTGSATQIVTFTNPTTGAFTLTATVTYQLSGGTMVTTATGSGTPTGPTTLAFSGPETVKSGTGTYAAVTGTLSYTGSADQATGKGQFSSSGSLTY